MGITDKNKEAIINLKIILSEIIECEESICYVTDIDAEPLRLAIKALEKQTPKKPIYDAENIKYPKCPNCGCILLYYSHLYKVDYCDECGQCLDWEVIE